MPPFLDVLEEVAKGWGGLKMETVPRSQSKEFRNFLNTLPITF